VGSRPRILVTGGTANIPIAEGLLLSHYVGQGYARAIAESGGLPLVLPNVDGFEDEMAAAAIELADGLLLTGGTDLNPATYGRLIDEKLTHDPDSARDRIEIALIKEARRQGLPILGICRGFQMLNVAYGGTLDQHRPHQHATIVENPNLRIELTEVLLTPGTLAANSLRTERVEVYCLHHQAIDDIGAGLRSTGVAADGLIEALEDPSADFVLGVLWHPEQMLEHEHARAIYESFLNAAGAQL
jgi:putative glutamine amidotransferase